MERAKKKNGECKDRLSDLPDALLLHILSFLSTETCVKTMNLVSHRYRNLWQHLRVFDFHHDFHKYGDYQPESFSSFSLFVNFVFARRRFRDIQKLRLSCGLYGLDKFSVCSFYNWVGIAIGPHLEELHLSLFGWKDLFGFLIPHSIFTSCPNLVSLSLSGDIRLSRDISLMINCSTICLPLLKKLIIDNHHADVSFVDKLLFCCPILEILEISSIFVSSLTKLRVPHSLKRLKFTPHSLKRLKFTSEIEDVLGPCLEIDAPGLKYLSLTRIPFDGSHIVNLHKVDEAYLDVCSWHCQRVSVDPLHRLLQALSGIKHLVLGRLTMQQLLHLGREFPEFPHIIHLEFILPCFNIGFMYQVLQKCPMLQAFIIRKHKDPLQQPYTWAPKPISVPICLVSHLTFIHFIGCQGYLDEMEYTRYVLRKGLVLKTMHFTSSSKTRWKNDRILTLLSKTPRGSVSCKLKFD